MLDSIFKKHSSSHVKQPNNDLTSNSNIENNAISAPDEEPIEYTEDIYTKSLLYGTISTIPSLFKISNHINQFRLLILQDINNLRSKQVLMDYSLPGSSSSSNNNNNNNINTPSSSNKSSFQNYSINELNNYIFGTHGIILNNSNYKFNKLNFLPVINNNSQNILISRIITIDSNFNIVYEEDITENEPTDINNCDWKPVSAVPSIESIITNNSSKTRFAVAIIIPIDESHLKEILFDNWSEISYYFKIFELLLIKKLKYVYQNKEVVNNTNNITTSTHSNNNNNNNNNNNANTNGHCHGNHTNNNNVNNAKLQFPKLLLQQDKQIINLFKTLINCLIKLLEIKRLFIIPFEQSNFTLINWSSIVSSWLEFKDGRNLLSIVKNPTNTLTNNPVVQESNLKFLSTLLSVLIPIRQKLMNPSNSPRELHRVVIKTGNPTVSQRLIFIIVGLIAYDQGIQLDLEGKSSFTTVKSMSDDTLLDPIFESDLTSTKPIPISKQRITPSHSIQQRSDNAAQTSSLSSTNTTTTVATNSSTNNTTATNSPPPLLKRKSSINPINLIPIASSSYTSSSSLSSSFINSNYEYQNHISIANNSFNSSDEFPLNYGITNANTHYNNNIYNNFSSTTANNSFNSNMALNSASTTPTYNSPITEYVNIKPDRSNKSFRLNRNSSYISLSNIANNDGLLEDSPSSNLSSSFKNWRSGGNTNGGGGASGAAAGAGAVGAGFGSNGNLGLGVTSGLTSSLSNSYTSSFLDKWKASVGSTKSNLTLNLKGDSLNKKPSFTNATTTKTEGLMPPRSLSLQFNNNKTPSPKSEFDGDYFTRTPQTPNSKSSSPIPPPVNNSSAASSVSPNLKFTNTKFFEKSNSIRNQFRSFDKLTKINRNSTCLMSSNVAPKSNVKDRITSLMSQPDVDIKILNSTTKLIELSLPSFSSAASGTEAKPKQKQIHITLPLMTGYLHEFTKEFTIHACSLQNTDQSILTSLKNYDFNRFNTMTKSNILIINLKSRELTQFVISKTNGTARDTTSKTNIEKFNLFRPGYSNPNKIDRGFVDFIDTNLNSISNIIQGTTTTTTTKPDGEEDESCEIERLSTEVMALLKKIISDYKTTVK